MEKDWEEFLKGLSQTIDSRLAPLEKQLESQQEIINKLTNNISLIVASIQEKTGKNFDLQEFTNSSTGSWPESELTENSCEKMMIEEEKVNEGSVN